MNRIEVESKGVLTMTGSATARVIENFAWQHLKAATLFRDHASRIEHENADRAFGGFFEEIRAYVSGTIMSGAAALETFINEAYITHNGPLRDHLSPFEEKFWGKNGVERWRILDKYDHAIALVGAASIDRNGMVYSNASGLIEFRNALIHFKPAWDSKRKRIVELEELLADRFPLSPFLDKNSGFVTMRAMSAGCASWAVATVLTFLREFNQRVPFDEGKMSGFWRLEV